MQGDMHMCPYIWFAGMQADAIRPVPAQGLLEQERHIGNNLVWDVPADGTKLAPLLHDTVEEGQPHKQAAERSVAHAALQELRTAEGVAGVRA